MTSIAFLFGGQGTEAPQMGLDLAEHVPAAAALLDRAGEVAGVDARRVLTSGGPEFARTSVIQPLLTAVGLGAWTALTDEGIEPAFVAGHSLGEVSAWCAAGAMTPADAIVLAGTRGRVMEREAARHPGGMLAVTSAGDQVAELVRDGQRVGSVVVAGQNAPDEWIVSGDAPALAVIASRHCATRLPVSGAWHSSAMAGAVEELRAATRLACTARPRVSVVTNRTGLIASLDDDVADLIAGQLVTPVQWARTIETLVAARITHFVTFGPSKVLRALVHKNARKVPVLVVETVADVRAVVQELRR